MESIFALLILLLVFILAGVIAAFLALARTGSLTQSVESYRDIIADLATAQKAVRNRLAKLEGDSSPPVETRGPPEVPKAPAAGVVQPLAPAAAPPAPEQLPQAVVSRDEVEVIVPAQPPEPPVETVVEPPKPEPTPQPAPPPLPTPPAAAPAAAKPAAHGTDWTSFESAAGKKWLTLAGVVILFLAAAFFLKHAFDVGWIGPGVQVLLAIIGGVVLLAFGEYFLRQEMRPLGRGLIGGGIMVLYAALFAAYSPDFYKEPVIANQTLTFALMCIVTIVGMTLAIRHDAISISFLAMLGGFLTPILVSKGTDARDVLFSYLLLLNLGVLGVAFYKKWRALDILAFVGTIVLFWGWYYKFGAGAPVGPPLAWLATFWAVFAIVPVAYHVRHGTMLTVERLVMSLANATYGFGFAYLILADRRGDLAWVAMVMSAAYLALGVLAKLRSSDAKAMFGFISLSMMFLTMFIPLHFILNGITLAWAAEAVVLVYLGFLFDYRPVRIGGFIVLLLGVARIFMVHIPIVAAQGEMVAAFANRNFWTMMCAPIASGLVAIVHQACRRKATFEDKQIQLICTIGAGLLALVLISFEMDQWFAGREDMSWAYRMYLRNCSLTVLWALGATAFLAGKRGSMSLPLRITGLLPLGGAILLIAYTFTIGSGTKPMLAINSLFGASLLACAVMWTYSLTWVKLHTRTVFTIGAGLLTLLLFSVELDRWFQTLDIAGPVLDYLHHCSMSVLWAVGTLAFLAGSKNKAMADPLRKAGLLPLGGAILLIANTFAIDPSAEQMQMLFINPRFGAALFICGVMWLHSLTWPDVQAKTAFCVLSSYLTVALLCAEVIPWVWRMSPHWEVDQRYTISWAATMLLTACAAVYLAVGRLKRVVEAYSTGLAPLAIAWICGLQAYLVVRQGSAMMFLNPQFAAALMGLLVIGAWAAVMHTDRRIFTRPSEAIAPLYTWFTISMLALLTTEPASWLYRNIPDPEQAIWSTQMSVTIVWGLYASTMLSIGFWRRVLPLRLAALALFGLTALKLLLVDMANVEQVYRIISFFVMGLLMVAASYLYHKAEKRLKKSDQAPAGE